VTGACTRDHDTRSSGSQFLFLDLGRGGQGPIQLPQNRYGCRLECLAKLKVFRSLYSGRSKVIMEVDSESEPATTLSNCSLVSSIDPFRSGTVFSGLPPSTAIPKGPSGRHANPLGLWIILSIAVLLGSHSPQTSPCCSFVHPLTVTCSLSNSLLAFSSSKVTSLGTCLVPQYTLTLVYTLTLY
jgi:hypothetical protein